MSHYTIRTDILSRMVQTVFGNNPFASYIWWRFRNGTHLSLIMCCDTCEVLLFFLIPSLIQKWVAWCCQNAGWHQGKETAVSQEPCNTYTYQLLVASCSLNTTSPFLTVTVFHNFVSVLPFMYFCLCTSAVSTCLCTNRYVLF